MHLLLLIPAPTEAERIFRAAKRMALAQKSTWEVLFVDTPATMRRHNAEENELNLQMATLASQMGAMVTQRQASSILEGVQEVLSERENSPHKPTQLLVAESTTRHTLLNYLIPSTARHLKKALNGQLDVSMIETGDELVSQAKAAGILRFTMQELLISLLVVALATFAIELIDYVWPQAILATQQRNKAVIYMTACAFTAGRYGLLSGLITAIASFLTFSLLYISPHFSTIMDEPSDGMSLVLFLTASALIALFGSQENRVRQVISKRADRMQSLLRIHRVTLNKRSRKDVLHALDQEITRLLHTPVAFFFPGMLNPAKLEQASPNPATLAAADQKALEVCWLERKTTGVGSPYDPGCKWRFEPMLTAQAEIGVVAVQIDKSVILDAAFSRMVNGIADQCALILERLEIGVAAEENRIQAEREKLRSMLLSSVSHDLKTPLASIIGSLSVYRGMEGKLPQEHRLTLIDTALGEAHRLDSFITNILDMTRIESGQVEMKSEWVEPVALAKDVRKRLKDRLQHHDFVMPEIPMDIEVQMDSVMTGQVLQNVIDNAVKYTTPGTRIELQVDTSKKNSFAYSIHDSGHGIPEDQLQNVFDKYARIKRQDSQVAGTGLGLAICKAVMEAQGGSIVAANHPNGGAVFTITLPKWRKAKPTKPKKAA